MKQPRVTDFDPNTQRGGILKSSMDNFPVIQKSVKKELIPSRKIKRRHPFDIYEDQIESLKKLSLENITNGGVGSMGAMIREAIDDYLLKNNLL